MTAKQELQSDAALMAQVRAGDKHPLAELFQRHHREIHGFLSRASRSATLADDLTQEVFLRVLRYRSTFDERREFRPWLFRIARNVLKDRFRQADTASVDDPHPETLEDPRPSALRTLEARERLERLEWAIARLSSEQRDALLLARFHDLAYRQIGEVLGCSEGAVKARVFRALKTISKLLASGPDTLGTEERS